MPTISPADQADRVPYWTDFAIHVIGVACGLVGAGILLNRFGLQSDGALQTAQTIYALTLVAMLTCSALYNTISPPQPHSWLRRADHAAIFLMIAGKVTPFVSMAKPPGASPPSP